MNRALATYYNLHWISYEGGPDSFGPNSIGAKKNASLSEAMVPIVTNFMKDWYSWGGELFNWFVWGTSSYDSQYGTW